MNGFNKDSCGMSWRVTSAREIHAFETGKSPKTLCGKPVYSTPANMMLGTDSRFFCEDCKRKLEGKP